MDLNDRVNPASYISCFVLVLLLPQIPASETSLTERKELDRKQDDLPKPRSDRSSFRHVEVTRISFRSSFWRCIPGESRGETGSILLAKLALLAAKNEYQQLPTSPNLDSGEKQSQERHQVGIASPSSRMEREKYKDKDKNDASSGNSTLPTTLTLFPPDVALVNPQL